MCYNKRLLLRKLNFISGFREGDSVPSGFSAVNNTSDTNEEALKESLV